MSQFESLKGYVRLNDDAMLAASTVPVIAKKRLSEISSFHLIRAQA